jgi:transposase
MLALGKRPRVYLSRVPTDMRCSFEGLSARARSVIQQDPLSGHLFVFLNRKRDYIKVLYWDDGGYCIWVSAANSAPPSKFQEIEIREGR